MFSLKNFLKDPVSTLLGALVGVLQAGFTAAILQYQQTPGQVYDWKPYAMAAATGMVTFIIGGLMKDMREVAAEPASILPGPINTAIGQPVPPSSAATPLPTDIILPVLTTTVANMSPLVIQALDTFITKTVHEQLGVKPAEEQPKLPNV